MRYIARACHRAAPRPRIILSAIERHRQKQSISISPSPPLVTNHAVAVAYFHPPPNKSTSQTMPSTGWLATAEMRAPLRILRSGATVLRLAYRLNSSSNVVCQLLCVYHTVLYGRKIMAPLSQSFCAVRCGALIARLRTITYRHVCRAKSSNRLLLHISADVFDHVPWWRVHCGMFTGNPCGNVRTRT